MVNKPPYGQPQYGQSPQEQTTNHGQPQPAPQYGQQTPMPQPAQYGAQHGAPYGQPQPPMPQSPQPQPYGQPIAQYGQASQTPQPPQYGQPQPMQQYGRQQPMAQPHQQPQPQPYGQPHPYGQRPPMPGNPPLQQAGTASKKPPMPVIIIGAVAAVIVIALVAVLFVTNHVSRSDYEEARSQVETLEKSYNAINEELSSALYSEDNDSAYTYRKVQKKLNTFKQDSDGLAALKAVKKDKDVNEKYQLYTQSYAKYEKYVGGLTKTLPVYMKMAQTCTKLPDFDYSDMSSYYREYSKMLGECSTAAGDLAQSSIKSYADYGKSMRNHAEDAKYIVDEIVKLDVSNLEYGSSKYKKFHQLSNDLTELDDIKSLDTNALEQEANDADLSKALTALDETISEKIR